MVRAREGSTRRSPPGRGLSLRGALREGEREAWREEGGEREGERRNEGTKRRETGDPSRCAVPWSCRRWVRGDAVLDGAGTPSGRAGLA